MRRYHDTLLSGNKSPVPGNRYDGSAYETVFFTPDNKEVIMLGRVIYDFVAHAPRYDIAKFEFTSSIRCLFFNLKY